MRIGPYFYRMTMMVISTTTTLTLFGKRVQGLSIDEVRQGMGLGVNLGQTFEIKKDWSVEGGVAPMTSAEDLLWPGESEVTIREAIEGYEALGFHAIRIPVRWTLSGTPSTRTPIPTALLQSVGTVVQTILDHGLFAIINVETHNGYLNGFISEEESVLTETYESFRGTWKTIADYFQDFDEHLLFESMNEVAYWETVWSSRTSEGDREEAYNLHRQVHQEFVNAVRSSGGYNPERYLLVAGYASDPILSQDHFLKTPNDSSHKIIISLFYYLPNYFTIIDKYATWGTTDDQKQLQTVINDLHYRFVGQGVPVIFTKYGTLLKNKSMANVRHYLTAIANATTSQNIPCFLSDRGEFINRTQVPLSFYDEELGEKYREMGQRFSPSKGKEEEEDDDDENDCFSLPDYPCCSDCALPVAWEEENNGKVQRWAIEHNEWCGLRSKCFETTTSTKTTTTTTTTTTTATTATSVPCWSESLGYSCCQSSNPFIYFTDEQGSWSVENGQWCGILN